LIWHLRRRVRRDADTRTHAHTHTPLVCSAAVTNVSRLWVSASTSQSTADKFAVAAVASGFCVEGFTATVEGIVGDDQHALVVMDVAKISEGQGRNLRTLATSNFGPAKSEAYAKRDAKKGAQCVRMGHAV
jgi:hypothetical protein